jgi:hypothetical protein
MKKPKKKPVNAPMVETDRYELGDLRLNPEEACARERESLLKLESKKKIQGQDELEDTERSSGHRMAWTEFIHRLQRCNPDLKPRDGSVNSIALYIKKMRHEYLESDAVPPNGVFFYDHRYVGGFPKEPIPEYSHVTLDTSNLPVREIRGWRSVLLNLMDNRALDYRKAVREFGDPSGDARSGRWMQQTQQYRNNL